MEMQKYKQYQIKIADLGLAREIDGNIITTFAGTPCFLAPEVHNKSATTSNENLQNKEELVQGSSLINSCKEDNQNKPQHILERT
ncbi:hypothetical protein IMG5_144710, partial [Ichthyophthirius multifiliis]